MLSGTGSRVNYKPVTPDPESNKALLLPFAAQLHITVQGQEQTCQWLLIRTKPPTLSRKLNYLWPSDNQVSLDDTSCPTPFLLCLGIDGSNLCLLPSHIDLQLHSMQGFSH